MPDVEKFRSTLPTRGSDAGRAHSPLPMPYFDPRSPRGGATPLHGLQRIHATYFDPRSPRGGATLAGLRDFKEDAYFDPRSPRGGATAIKIPHGCNRAISIHAPHEGERPLAAPCARLLILFRSTLPTRGSDQSRGRNNRKYKHFDPRSPRGGATAEKCICMQHFREFAEYYPLRHGDARCVAPQDCIIQAFFGAKKWCFYVRLCFALKNKGVRG